ncbi:aspartic peptidase domain-containing protein, partial [Mycena latifolia]
VINHDLIESPIFSFRLGSSDEDGGEAVFGGIDPDAFTGDIQYVHVRRRGYWELELEKVSFDDEELELENTGAALDTGATNLIQKKKKIVPTDVAEMLYTQIGATKLWLGQYTIDCDESPIFPNWPSSTGGGRVPLPLVGTISTWPMEGSGALVSTLSSFPHNYLNPATGDTFLRKCYTVYDLARDAVGFDTSA